MGNDVKAEPADDEEGVPFDNPELYEQWTGRWSRGFASPVVDWVAPVNNAAWLDVGCGTGALTWAILKHDPLSATLWVCGIDCWEKGIVWSRVHSGAGLQRCPIAWVVETDHRATFRIVEKPSLATLPFGDGTFAYAGGALMLHLGEDPVATLRDMARVCRPGGTVFGYVWDFFNGMQPFKEVIDAVLAISTEVLKVDLRERDASVKKRMTRLEVCSESALLERMAAAGLTDCAVRSFEDTDLGSQFEAYLNFLEQGEGIAAFLVDHLAKALARAIPAGAPKVRELLEDRLRAPLGVGADGAMRLTLRVLAFRGRVPRSGLGAGS